MKTRVLGIFIWIVIFTTAIWMTLIILRQLSLPPVETLADQVAAIESQYGLFVINYVDAALITLFSVAMFASFYVYFHRQAPVWAAIALAFVPMYGLTNMLVYLSQVFVVPGLLVQYHNPQTAATAGMLLEQFIHEWPGSAAAFANGLAYAMLGIPSLIVGILLSHQLKVGIRMGGILMVLSGILSILALIGMGFNSPILMSMILISGFVYMVALVFVAVNLMRF